MLRSVFLFDPHHVLRETIHNPRKSVREICDLINVRQLEEGAQIKPRWGWKICVFPQPSASYYACTQWAHETFVPFFFFFLCPPLGLFKNHNLVTPNKTDGIPNNPMLTQSLRDWGVLGSVPHSDLSLGKPTELLEGSVPCLWVGSVNDDPVKHWMSITRYSQLPATGQMEP